jgi:hypothetical protein
MCFVCNITLVEIEGNKNLLRLGTQPFKDGVPKNTHRGFVIHLVEEGLDIYKA